MKVAAVIPAYNEESTIVQVVEEAQKYCDIVVVVDDCSTDRTPQIIQKLRIKYALHGKNKGAGAATRTGILMALKLRADIIVTLDGDGQHNPSQIPWLLSPFRVQNIPDIVIGSRFWGKINKMPRYRSFGIQAITWLYNIGSKYKISDSQCCFRAFKREVLESIKITEDGFGFSTEILIKARKFGYRVVEVPVNCIYHKNFHQNSTLNPLRHGFEVALKTIKWRLRVEMAGRKE